MERKIGLSYGCIDLAVYVDISELVMDISDNDQSDAEDNVTESQPDMSSLLCNPYQ